MTDRVGDAIEPERAAFWFLGGTDEQAWAKIKTSINAGATLADIGEFSGEVARLVLGDPIPVGTPAGSVMIWRQS